MRGLFLAVLSLVVACSSSEEANPGAGGSSGDAAVEAATGGAGGDADKDADVLDAAPDAALAPCPQFADAVVAGTVNAPALTEASGIVAGRSSAGLWVHNDSGDSPRVFQIDADGKLMWTVDISGAQAVDWEDIARAPSVSGIDLYLGDIGDNAKQRTSVQVYRVAEPVGVTAATAETLELTYPGGQAWNAETLLVDPMSGDLYIVAKELLGKSPVFRAAAPLSFGGSIKLEQVAIIDFAQFGGGTLATGGDVSPDGSLVVVRTYGTAFAWRRPKGAPLHAAFDTEACPLPLAKEPQGEAIGFSDDGASYYTVSEGTSPTLYRYDRL